MDRNRNWHGVDVNNEASLFEYGFLLRWIGDDEYEVVYQFIRQSLKQEDCIQMFAYATFKVSDWIKDLINSTESYPNLNGIADWTGARTAGDYIVEVFNNPVRLLSDLLGYHGEQNIFGDTYGGYTEQEIRKRLNKALS